MAALTGAAGVGLGAFGAHALKETLAASNTTDIWRTAVLYHLVHAAAAFAAMTSALSERLRPAVLCWLLGTLLFCGSLYGLALGGPRQLGPITPLGGVLFIVGWLLAGGRLGRVERT